MRRVWTKYPYTRTKSLHVMRVKRTTNCERNDRPYSLCTRLEIQKSGVIYMLLLQFGLEIAGVGAATKVSDFSRGRKLLLMSVTVIIVIETSILFMSENTAIKLSGFLRTYFRVINVYRKKNRFVFKPMK